MNKVTKAYLTGLSTGVIEVSNVRFTPAAEQEIDRDAEVKRYLTKQTGSFTAQLTINKAGFRKLVRAIHRMTKAMWRFRPTGARKAWRRSMMHSAPRVRKHGRVQPSRRRTR